MHLRRITLLSEQYPRADVYPFSLPQLRETRQLELCAPVTFFVGENGSGKSTLLEAITEGCGIHIWRGMDRTRCSYNRHERELHRYLELEWHDGAVPGAHFGSDIFHNFAQLVDEWAAADPGVLGYFGDASLLTQSHGQSLMSYFCARFALRGLYLLDEPETALSPRSQIRFLRLLEQTAAGGEAQYIIATHSPILLSCPGAVIYSFDTAPLRTLRYEETEHFRLYRDFLANPGGYC